MASSPENPQLDPDSAAPLEAALREHWPPAHWRDVTVVLAVSGGADSVALLRGAAALRGQSDGQLVAGHFHHGLRAEADSDEQFVVELCRQSNLPCRVGRADVAALAGAQGDGLEAAARQARYDYFLQLARQTGARYVATAHTADDQVETILHRIVRGTGLRGLAGMPAVRPLAAGVSLVRPLLKISRREVLAYLESIGQGYCVDASNRDLSFTRNRLRHELLPLLGRQYNEKIGEALRRLGELAGEAQQVIDATVAQLRESGMRREGDRLRLDLSALGGESNFLLRELFKSVWREQGWSEQDMSYEKWHQLAELACGALSPAALDLPGGVSARREGTELVLKKD